MATRCVSTVMYKHFLQLLLRYMSIKKKKNVFGIGLHSFFISNFFPRDKYEELMFNKYSTVAIILYNIQREIINTK